MNKKKVCFNLDERIIRQVKQMALDNDTTATKIYTGWITDGLKSEGIELPED